jgi:hypothetical protein
MNRALARRRIRHAAAAAAGALAAVAGLACTPDVGSNPVPTAMQFDLTATPPRAPQPTALIIDQQTGHINFALAGTPIPDDCSMQQVLPEAQCLFDQWLQTLNGFPSVTTASAPASGPLDPATLTLGAGQNVVVVGATQNVVATPAELAVGFDDPSTSVTIAPLQPWALGEFYWAGVRGYANGVRDAAGGEVVGSPTMALLKQEEPLTCGATDPAHVDPHCPGFEVVAQGSPPGADPGMQLFQLDAIRSSYFAGSAFGLMEGAGLPKDEIAVLWGFPIHTNSVPLLAPGTPAVPHVPAANLILVGVQGAVDPATVSAFVVRAQNGPVVVMDLTAAAMGDLNAGFPPVGAAYREDLHAIAIQAQAPFPAGHQIGLFFTNGIKSPDGAPLVASPVSVLLSLSARLLDSSGRSVISGVSDSDASLLEAGRAALQPLLDNPIFTPLTGVSRANLVYCYAFVPMVMP